MPLALRPAVFVNRSQKASKEEAEAERARAGGGPCVLGKKEPEGPGDAETKRYTCGGCGVRVVGYKAWRAHLAKQKKARKRALQGSAEKTKKKNEQRKRKKARLKENSGAR